jgi:hypothetical protein
LTVVVTILIIVIAVAVVAFAANALRSAGETAERLVDSKSPVAKRPMPIVSEFHVEGDTATTLFAVPLGDAEPGRHLVELLCASAVEYVRDRANEGLPLDGVRRIEVSAMRGHNPETLCTVDLPDPGVLPDRDDKVLVEPTHDPIAAVHAVVADTTVASSPGEPASLGSIAELVELSGPTEAHLRAIGVDTDEMALKDLVLGLLRVSGYDVHVGRSGLSESLGGKADIYGLIRNGQQTLLVILPHEEGSHPELEDSVLARFAVEVAQSNPDQAILVTDKYSPYSMYEREKRDIRCVFITRERLQAFVDSFGLT